MIRGDMWWTTFTHFGWAYCCTDSLGRMVFAIDGLHAVLVNQQWALHAPLVSQRLLEQHIEHIVMHLAGRFSDPCLICDDQRIVLQNIETFNPAVDLAYVGYREGYKDERLQGHTSEA